VTGYERRRAQRAVKALVDPLAAAVLLVVLSPLVGAVALWTLLDAGRPVLFVSPRAGRGGETFRMLKFRTMIPDAVAEGRRLALTPDPFGLVPDDPRITRSGRFLRRTGLDEVPQLVNVLRGDMSLVGPRPDLVEQAEHYTEEEARRLDAKPGITGWSQIHGREDQTWADRFGYDAWYLEHWSLWLDARILLRTVGQLFRPEPVPVVDPLNVERAQAGAREKGES